jgi:hypothetical protein
MIKDLQELALDYDIGKVIERSPLKNVLSVATDIDADPEEVINFIRYQLGRSTRNQIWALPSKSGNRPVFAEELIKRIEALSSKAAEVAKENEVASSSRQPMIHLKLIRLYLGYLGRYHTYLKWNYEQQRLKGER